MQDYGFWCHGIIIVKYFVSLIYIYLINKTSIYKIFIMKKEQLMTNRSIIEF